MFLFSEKFWENFWKTPIPVKYILSQNNHKDISLIRKLEMGQILSTF